MAGITSVKDIKKGDRVFALGQKDLYLWTALEDAVKHPDHIAVHVRYPDGGDGWREWNLIPDVSLLVDNRDETD